MNRQFSIFLMLVAPACATFWIVSGLLTEKHVDHPASGPPVGMRYHLEPAGSTGVASLESERRHSASGKAAPLADNDGASIDYNIPPHDKDVAGSSGSPSFSPDNEATRRTPITATADTRARTNSNTISNSNKRIPSERRLPNRERESTASRFGHRGGSSSTFTTPGQGPSVIPAMPENQVTTVTNDSEHQPEAKSNNHSESEEVNPGNMLESADSPMEHVAGSAVPPQPAVWVDLGSDSGLTEEGQGEVQMMAESLQQRIAGSGFDPVSPEYSRLWNDSVNESDQLFRQRYGNAAWSLHHVEAYHMSHSSGGSQP